MMSRSTHLALLAIAGLVLVAVQSLTAAGAAPDGARAALTAVSGTGSGLVLIAPTAEDQGTFAVEVTPDGVCTLASGWLTNGPLDTSSAGAGAAHFEVHRGAPFVSGVRFDAEFRVLGADGTELRSECVTVTVK